MKDRGFRDFYMFAQLKAGISIEQARARLSTIAANLAGQSENLGQLRWRLGKGHCRSVWRAGSGGAVIAQHVRDRAGSLFFDGKCGGSAE